MPDTGGFDVVAELTVGVLRQILDGAWDNSIIPHSVNVPPNTAFGPYQVQDGVVNIPRAGLNLDMAPAANGVRVTLPSQIQVHIANPPIPSASLFDMTADIVVVAPLGTLPDSIQVGVLLAGLPRSAVSVTLTSGDPIGPITLAMIREYVHNWYTDHPGEQERTMTGVGVGPFTADAYVRIFDDSADPNHQITVTPAGSDIKLSIPLYLRLSNMTAPSSFPAPLSPLGVEAKVTVTVPLVAVPGSISANLPAAPLVVESLGPATPYATGSPAEGTNYATDKAGASAFGLDLDALLRSQIEARGQAILTSIGPITIVVPTVAQIQDFIGDQVHAALITQGHIALWTPAPPAGGGVTVSNVTIKALSDALAICLNDPGGADPAVIVNFIPAGRSCAIAINGAKVLQIIDQTIHRPEDQGGFGPDFPPKTFHDVNDHDARLDSLTISLRDGSIHMEGDVTVIDAIAGKIDVGASFDADSGLRWKDAPDGTQMIEPFLLGDPDVDLSLLAWIVSFLLGFISFGLIGGIVALVVLAVVEGIAQQVGGQIIRDDVTNQITGLGPWPQTLEGIGTVTARFENPVVIESSGISFPDAYLVTATFAATVDALARANGPYLAAGGAPLALHGGPAAVDTQYQWSFGDGGTAGGAAQSHVYADNGLYVAKLTTTVTQPGGVTTRQFARVVVRNVPPTVDAGPDIAIDEGQVVMYVAAFTDPEWPDTHKASFNWGDDSPVTPGAVAETNAPPAAQGSAQASHAYCDNGVYVVTALVEDDDGGVGRATKRVTVRNVPPTVDAGPDLFAYACTPITLVACFTDPGWCDTHTGVWDFGDCTPPQPAIVRERHEPPAGTGIAAAAHVYDGCGNYLAVCTVTDDDGGVGQDTLIVRVVDVLNRDFEGGFRNRRVGTVANHWEPYLNGAPDFLAAATGQGGGTGVFSAEEFVVHGGQRSQRVGGLSAFQAGLYQKVGANTDWDYQVTAWYHLDERYGGVCRLGVDPQGGDDPASADIVWSEGSEHRDWTQLAVRVTAARRAVTLFLETRSQDRGALAFFDDVALLPYPCPLDEKVCLPAVPTEEKACVDWKEEKEPRELGAVYEQSGFTFTSVSQQPLRIVLSGVPAGQGKLVLPGRNLQIALPFAADRVVAQVVLQAGQPIVMQALDAANARVGQAASTTVQNVVQTLEVVAPGITSLLFQGGSNEGALVELCIYRQTGEPTTTPQKG